MADFDPEVNIEALHELIEARIKQGFPSFPTVEFYRDDEEQLLPTPACLLSMSDLEIAPDDYGTSQLPVLMRFEAHIVMPHRSKSTKIELRKAATAFAAWLHQLRHFGIGGAITVIACEPDEFAPVHEKFMAWRVEWVIPGALGETAWKNDGVIPTDVMFSWSPEIGFGNEGKYEPALDTTP